MNLLYFFNLLIIQHILKYQLIFPPLQFQLLLLHLPFQQPIGIHYLLIVIFLDLFQLRILPHILTKPIDPFFNQQIFTTILLDILINYFQQIIIFQLFFLFFQIRLLVFSKIVIRYIFVKILFHLTRWIRYLPLKEFSNSRKIFSSPKILIASTSRQLYSCCIIKSITFFLIISPTQLSNPIFPMHLFLDQLIDIIVSFPDLMFSQPRIHYFGDIV